MIYKAPKSRKESGLNW